MYIYIHIYMYHLNFMSGNDEESLEKTQSGEEISGPPREREGKAKIIYWALKIVTMSLCLLMAATSVIGLSKFFLCIFILKLCMI